MGRDCKEGQCRNNQREATFKRKEKKAGTGMGLGVTRRQRGQSHARDGRSVATLKVLEALPYPVLGRRFQNRSKLDAPVFCKDLFLGSINLYQLFI